MDKNKGKKNNNKTNNSQDEKTKVYKVKGSKKEKNKKGKKKHSKLIKIILRLILIMFILFILAGIAGGGVLAGIFFSDKYKVTREELEIKNFNSTVLDKDENVVATINGNENRKWIKIDDMPDYLPKMFVAMEDERFYSHNGIDIKRTLGATLQFLTKGGSSSYGGSTITQQLIKNTFEDDDDSGMAGVERKIREMARAYNTEQVLSKDEILEKYLNKIFMGGTYYGVGTGAKYYFNKEVKDLSLAESAYLVAINTSPNAYKPFSEEEKDREKIKSKVKVVLTKFKEEASNLGYELSEEAYNAAIEEANNGLKFEKGEVITNKASYSYHTAAAIDEVVKDLAKKEGLTEKEARTRIENNGYTIYSTQDSYIQSVMEEEFLKDKYIKSGRETDDEGNLINDHTQAAMVIIDHTTGRVVATVGGLGEDSNPVGLNRATQSTKQTGSSIKPLACEAPALENGIINPGTVYDDSPTSFGSYSPHNSSYSFSGLITIRQALAESSNIVHVKIMKEVGPSVSREFLGKMGINIDEQHESISMALGTADVSVLDMAAGYACVANDGVYIEPTFYTKVLDSNGNVILETEQETRRVMTEGNAYVLKDLLKSPARSGTAAVCYMSNQDVGAKTGSTDNYVDRWLCGFTPYYTASVWFGFDYSERPVFSGNNAANIWAAVMKEIHSDLETRRFERPSNVVSARICTDSGCIATDSCENTTSEVFVKGSLPGQCEGHQKLKICKETGKIANEYCKDTEEVTYLVKPPKENTSLWKTDPGDKYDIPTETCDVHKAPAKVKMIDVLGMTSTDAKKKIEALGLKVETKTKEDKNKKDGIVLEQSVKANTEIEKGKTITLTINKLQSINTNTTNTNTTVTNTTNANNTTI